MHAYVYIVCLILTNIMYFSFLKNFVPLFPQAQDWVITVALSLSERLQCAHVNAVAINKSF